MGGEAALLMRMLEPTVRPMGVPAPRVRPQLPIEQQNFDEVLEQAAAREPVKISGHAQQRLHQMGVLLDDSQMQALGEATDQIGRASGRERV